MRNQSYIELHILTFSLGFWILGSNSVFLFKPLVHEKIGSKRIHPVANPWLSRSEPVFCSNWEERYCFQNPYLNRSEAVGQPVVSRSKKYGFWALVPGCLHAPLNAQECQAQPFQWRKNGDCEATKKKRKPWKNIEIRNQWKMVILWWLNQ